MIKSNQNPISFRPILLGFFIMASACAKKSDVQQADGDVLVKIGVQESASEYNFKVVKLSGIEKLSEVCGAFVRFFYSPGSTGTALTGTAPHAQFIHTKNFFVPSDMISMQMAAIYYHLQNLAAFDKEVGADGVNRWPRSVGLETQVSDSNTGIQKNNAFYNGQTDSMMFVPYTNSNLPISVNAGIIAHEHFHSLFYKMVMRPAFLTQKISLASASVHADENDNVQLAHTAAPIAMTETEKAQTYNETYLRGVNEGLADFWGWVYTDDPEFMRWSLPEFQANRTLTMAADSEGRYETKEKILNRIEEAMQFSENPKADLVRYSYKIGTPHARFLKQLSVLQASSKNIALGDSKKILSQVVFSYIKDLGEKMKTLQENETIDPLSLFDYVANLANEKNLIRLDQSSCEFLVKYFNTGMNDRQKLAQCKKQEQEPRQGMTGSDQKDSTYVIFKSQVVKP